MAKTKNAGVEKLFESCERLLGRTPDDPELKALLVGQDLWPVPDFEEEELSVFLENEEAGFSLKFDESLSVDHPVAKGKPAGTPVFVTAYFYAEGVEDYHAYAGTLPAGVAFSDTASDLQRKLGAPGREITNKRTGALSAQAWPRGQWWLTASYKDGGASVNRFTLNIF